jgi:hypothetical protein
MWRPLATIWPTPGGAAAWLARSSRECTRGVTTQSTKYGNRPGYQIRTISSLVFEPPH